MSTSELVVFRVKIVNQNDSACFCEIKFCWLLQTKIRCY